MRTNTCCVLGVATLILTACGGGGGGGGAAPSVVRPTAPTTISGLVTPPVSVVNGAATASTTILTPPNTTETWSAVVQSADHIFDSAAILATPSLLKATALNIKPVDTATGSFSVTTGAANPADPATGQTLSITNVLGGVASVLGGVSSQTTMGGLPAALITNNPAGTLSGYVLPYSATLNPSGYAYQTFGMWMTFNPATMVFSTNYFSAGTVSVPGSLPVAGTASYTGKASGSLIDAATRDMSDVNANMNATANFASRSITFATTGSTSLSANAALGVLPSANSGLDMSGTLNYAAGSNTFTGSVSTVNGMTGNATGRFYGPGIIAPTANQVLGAPPEIGGTFAVMNPGVAGMYGAFGGSGSNPPTIVPIPTVIAGTVTAPVAPAVGLIGVYPNMLVAPNVNINANFYTIVQSADYGFSATSPRFLPRQVISLNIKPVDVVGTNTMQIGTGAAYLLDPTLGQTVSVTNTVGNIAYTIDVINGAVTTQTTLAGLPAVTIANSLVPSTSSYVMPYSVTMNPAGYTYQTFGSWQSTNGVTGLVSENYFSGGVSTVAGTLPVLGTATYTGQAAGTYVNAVTNDPSQTTATMSATANFAARTVAFSTTGTTSLSNNAVAGTLPTANAALNMSGTLSYAAGNNTFTGAVTTTNGMSGNATGRFYGPGIAAATPTKAIGAPPEIGGTFAVMATGVGAMQGAFGGK